MEPCPPSSRLRNLGERKPVTKGTQREHPPRPHSRKRQTMGGSAAVNHRPPPRQVRPPRPRGAAPGPPTRPRGAPGPPPPGLTPAGLREPPEPAAPGLPTGGTPGAPPGGTPELSAVGTRGAVGAHAGPARTRQSTGPAPASPAARGEGYVERGAAPTRDPPRPPRPHPWAPHRYRPSLRRGARPGCPRTTGGARQRRSRPQRGAGRDSPVHCTRRRPVGSGVEAPQ